MIEKNRKIYFVNFIFEESSQDIWRDYYDFLNARNKTHTYSNISLKIIGEIQEKLLWWYSEESKTYAKDSPVITSEFSIVPHDSSITEISIILDDNIVLRDLFFQMCEWMVTKYRLSYHFSVSKDKKIKFEFSDQTEFYKTIVTRKIEAKSQSLQNQIKEEQQFIDLFSQPEQQNPWDLIPDHRWDRIAVKLWCSNKTCIEISKELSNLGINVSEARVRNRLSELRKNVEYGHLIPKKIFYKNKKINQ